MAGLMVGGVAMAVAAEAMAVQGAMVEGATVEAEALMVAAGDHMGEAAAMAGAIQHSGVIETLRSEPIVLLIVGMAECHIRHLASYKGE